MPDRDPANLNELSKSVFLDAMDLPESQQFDFVKSACEGNEELRELVLQLLDFHKDGDGIIGNVASLDQVLKLPESDALDVQSPLLIRLDNGEQANFTDLREIGSGGFATVYRARESEAPRREVAIKLLKRLTDESAFRFKTEQRVVSKMKHECIVKLLQSGTTQNDERALVFEYIDGISVTQFCAQRDLSVHEKLLLFRDVCKTFSYIHQQGVVHRDVKPENILVTSCDEHTAPKIIDFGVSKILDPSPMERINPFDTQDGQFVGTPAYMAPEQVKLSLDAIDQRTDIFGLGVLLNEILLGKTPYSGELVSGFDVLNHFEKIRNEQANRPSIQVLARDQQQSPESLGQSDKLARRLRGDIDNIILKCLQKEPSSRYQTVEALVTDLDAYLSGEPVSASSAEHRQSLSHLLDSADWNSEKADEIQTSTGLLETSNLISIQPLRDCLESSLKKLPTGQHHGLREKSNTLAIAIRLLESEIQEGSRANAKLVFEKLLTSLNDLASQIYAVLELDED